MSDLSQLEVMKRFANFWSNVSNLWVDKTVKPEMQAAIIRGMEKAYGPEPRRREDAQDIRST